MATPHVTGRGRAHRRASIPSFSLAQIRERILTGVDPLADEIEVHRHERHG